jgi:hypothetical protein
LPHTETQGNTIATDINVDGLHQKRLHTILYDNPFGDQITLTSPSTPVGSNGSTTPSTWDDLYRLVCGCDAADRGSRGAKTIRNGWIAGGSKRGSRQVHPIYKLQIALKLRGSDSDWQYKYRPQHVVHEELCMVLQKRAFRVISNEPDNASKNDPNKQHVAMTNATAISSVVEISLNTYNPRLATHILVHEIAFGPDCDPSVRGVSLWFNIIENDVTICTPQQAKRFRWKKTGGNPAVNAATLDKKSRLLGGHSNSKSTSSNKPSVFDSGSIDNFQMTRPHDDATFRLVTDIMKHRLAVLKRERLSNMKERFEALEKLQRQEGWLKERFVNHRQSWLHWAWPINRGREYVDESTPVPPVEGPYEVESQKKGSSTEDNELNQPSVENEDPASDSDAAELGKNVCRVWESFVTTCIDNNSEKKCEVEDQVSPLLR